MLHRMLYIVRPFFIAILTASLFSDSGRGEDWPQWRGKNRDGVWTETGLVEKFATDRLTPKWRAEIGAGYCGPTVANGRVFVMDRQTKPASTERVLCFDEKTGEKVWGYEYPCNYGSVRYPAGPRASVTIHEGKAYSIGSTGHTFCFDASDGKVLWQKDLEAVYDIDMPIWGIAASPLIYENLVILHIGGRGGACVVALDRNSGQEAWRALNDQGQYSAPILVEQAGQPVVICWTGDSVAGLHAPTGKVLWRYVWKPRNMPIGVATPVVEKDRVFFTSFYDGSLMLRLLIDKTEVEKVWQIAGRNEQNTLALHTIISTPVFRDGYVYGVDSYGELRCLDGATGERLWEDTTATPRARWSNIHFVRNGDRYWMFNERGELIIGLLSPEGFKEISRAKLIEPTTAQLNERGGVCWSHPAFANRHVFVRNDKELVCASLEAK